MDHKVVNKHNAYKLNEYRDDLEIVSGYIGTDGKFYINWAIAGKYDKDEGKNKPIVKSEGGYLSVPVKIVLGNLAQAVEGVEWLLKQLKDKQTNPAPGKEDAPF